MSPWWWDQRVAYTPLAGELQDLGAIAAAAAAAILLLAVATRRTPRWPAAGRTAALAVVAVAAVAALWNWSLADDWGVAAANRELGPLANLAASYRGWTGRYTTYLLEAPYGWAVAPALGSVLWAWTLLAALIAGGWYALAGVLRPLPGRHRLALAASVGATAVWIVIQVWPGHGLYWFCATTTYAIGLAGFLAMIGVAVRAGRRSAIATGLAMAALGLALGGIGETMPVAMLPVLLAWTARAWRLRLPSRWAWTWAVLAVTAGLAANACSPGTAARHRVIEDGAGQAITGFDRLPTGTWLATWSLRSLGDAWAWVAHPVMVLAALAAVPGGVHLGRRLGWDRRPGWSEPLAAWLLVLAVIAAGYLPSYLVFSHAPPWRARDALQGLVVILGLIAWCRTLAAWRAAGRDPGRCALAVAAAVAVAGTASLLATSRNPTMQFALAATAAGAIAAALAWRRGAIPRAGAGWLLAAALLLGGSLPQLVADAAWVGPRWRAAQGVADGIMAASAPGTARFPRIETADRPQHLWYYGPGTDPQHWLNRGVAAWYRCAEVGTWP